VCRFSKNRFQPSETSHVAENKFARKQRRAIEEMLMRSTSGLCSVNPPPFRLPPDCKTLAHAIRTVVMSFVDAHLQRRMAIRERNELLPVLRAVSRPRLRAFCTRALQAVAVIKPKIGSPGGQVRISFRVRSATPGVSWSMPKKNDGNGKNIAAAAGRARGILTRAC